MRCRSRSDWSEGLRCKIEKRCQLLIWSITLAATELRCEMRQPAAKPGEDRAEVACPFPGYLTGYAMLLGFPGPAEAILIV
jgi:hypothetical protein